VPRWSSCVQSWKHYAAGWEPVELMEAAVFGGAGRACRRRGHSVASLDQPGATVR